MIVAGLVLLAAGVFGFAYLAGLLPPVVSLPLDRPGVIYAVAASIVAIAAGALLIAARLAG